MLSVSSAAPAMNAHNGVSYDQLVMQSETEFRVHGSAYTDQAVFEAEMSRIFKKTWVYVGHESEIPQAGDYKTSYIGLQPVIVSRAKDAGIHVLVNRCVHRGAAIVREVRGNLPEFRCPYHGWVYGGDGSLVSIADRRDSGGYAENFNAPAGLYRVPRIANYRGLIFASFNLEVEDIESYLGEMKTLIDNKFDLSPTGRIKISSLPYIVRFPANWKFQAENIVDAYHFMHTHGAFVKLQAKFGDSTGDFGVHKGGGGRAMRQERFRGSTWNCAGGHGLASYPSSDVEATLSGDFSAFYQDLLRLRGEEQFAWITGKATGTVFPSMGLIHQQIRIWRPIAANMTEVTIYPYELEGAPAAFNEGMLRSQERFYGPAGHGMADDIDIFGRNQQGLQGDVLEWLIIERGIDTDEPLANGDIKGLPSSEAPQRALWREWAKLMK